MEGKEPKLKLKLTDNFYTYKQGNCQIKSWLLHLNNVLPHLDVLYNEATDSYISNGLSIKKRQQDVIQWINSNK